MEIIEVAFPYEMTDDKFVWHLQKSGTIKWEVFGSEGYWRIVGRNLLLNKHPYISTWYISSLPFFIVLKVFQKQKTIVKEWSKLDFDALEAEGKKWSDKYRDSSDF